MSKHIPMEDKIKDFDRSIERMMNESVAEPPFGMWNRISAELEVTEVLPIAVAAPVSFAAKRAAFGFIAVASLISTSLLTALWMGNHQPASVDLPGKSAANQIRTAEEKLTVTSEPNIEILPAKTITRVKSKTSEKLTIEKASPVNQGQDEKNQMPVTEIGVPSAINNLEGSRAAEVFYFPPVDINTNSTLKQTIAEQTSNTDNEEKVVEKKTKSVSQNNDRRISIRKHKRGSGFTYGSLNRLKKQKPRY